MKKNQSFQNFLSYDKNKKKCIDKIKEISLVHNTGHITITTKKGNEYKTRLADLIIELRTDQNSEIVKHGSTIFENIIIFKYIEKRSEEFDKIVQQAKLKILNTFQTDLGCFEVTVRLNNIAKLDLIFA